VTDKTAARSNGSTVAVLHCTGSVVHGLVGTPGPDPTVTAWQEFSADDAERIVAWLAESGAQSIIGVLPAAAVVCRTCTLPDVASPQLEQALALQAEAHLLTEVPEHRRVRAVLPKASGETTRSGILLAWPQSARDGDLPVARFVGDSQEVTFIPDVAALAALLNGQRSDTPLLFFDRRDGSVALVVSHAQGAVIRAARVASTASADLSTAISRVVAETAMSVNHTPQFIENLVAETTRRLRDAPDTGGLLGPDEVIEGAAARLRGTPNDPAWWQAYGVAAGALLAAGGPLAPLTALRMNAPVIAPSRRRQLVAALSSPRRATIVVAVCLLIVAFGPWLISGLRIGVLSLKLPQLDRSLEAARQAEMQLEMYRELEKRAWPMTKLLADIACSTPESIDIEQIRIRHGERIAITGRARKDGDRTAQQVTALMGDNLHNTEVFSQIYLNWGDPNNFDAYEFSLTAEVVDPYRIHDYPLELDYGRWTLSDRLYRRDYIPDAETVLAEIEDALPPPGTAMQTASTVTPAARTDTPTASPGTPAAVIDPTPREGARATRRRSFGGMSGSGNGSGGAGFRGSDRGGSGGAIPMSQDIPEPITVEEVALMDLAEANEARGRIAQAIQQARVDEETEKRLRLEFRLVLNRVRELKAASGRSP